MKKKISKGLAYVVAVAICVTTGMLYILNTGEDSYADVIRIPNDGVAMETPYGDSRIPSSYENADYYDCYIPYELTNRDVGGYATSYSNARVSTYAYSMMDYPARLDWKIGTHFNLYKNLATSSNGFHSQYAVKEEADTGADIVVDGNGNEYYVNAFGAFFYNFAGLALNSGSSFPTFDQSSNGQVVDLILTDGTVLHFLNQDHKSLNHTNGGDNGVSRPNNDVQYQFANLNYKQYANIFQAAAGETFEIYGTSQSPSKVPAKYGISGTGVKVAIVRMYNLDLDNGSPTRTLGSEVSHKLADHAQITAADGNYAAGSSDLSIAGSSIVEEWQLIGMPTVFDLTGYQTMMDLPTRANLSVTDTATVADIGEAITLRSESASFDNMRVAITFIGLLLVLYGILLITAMMLDRVNSFVDLSFVSLLTFGRLKYDPYALDNLSGNETSGAISTKRIVIASVLTILVGMLLLTSTLTIWIGKILYIIYNKL